MPLELYELAGADDMRFSPYCWRTRMALAHKGLDVEAIPCRFTEKERIAFSGQKRVPVLRDGETVVSDSWQIACYLEDTYPDRPALFGSDSARSLARFINHWADTQINPVFARAIVKDIYDRVAPEDRDYFRQTREHVFGATLEELQAGREKHVKQLQVNLTPARNLLKEQSFLSGSSPAYADYILFGNFQWVRFASGLDILAKDDPLYGWRERMLDLFDGMPRSGQGAPAIAAQA